MAKGWISLHRKLMDKSLWTSEPFTRGQAWVDLLLLANHKDDYIYVRGNKITIRRGQVGWSQKKLAERWQWNRKKVRKFLKDLEEEQQITQQKNFVTSIIAINNYDDYQQNTQQNDHQRGQQRDSRGDTNNNGNNGNNENKHARADFEKPSLEKVKEIGNMRGITPQECQNFYDKMEEKEWLRYDKTAEQWVPLTNWHNMLSRYSRNGYLRPDQNVTESTAPKKSKVETS